MDEPSTISARIREGIAALRSGDRAAAHRLFTELTETAPANDNAWIGLALSSPTASEAAAALHRAERLNPTGRFVAQAEADLTTRVPGFAAALAAARTTTIAPRLPAAPRTTTVSTVPPLPTQNSKLVLTADPPPFTRTHATVSENRATQRMVLNIGLGLLVLLLIIILVGYGLLNYVQKLPQSPTGMPFRVIGDPTNPPLALTPPAAHVPPAAATPTTAKPPADQSIAAPSPADGPTAADPARQQALDAMRAGRYAEAIPALEAATERHPDDAEALYNLGVAYLGATNSPHSLEDATLTFRTLQALHPLWAPGLDMLARSLIAQGQFRDAVTPAHQAVESDPSRAEYWTTLGQAYQGAGAATEATKAYAEAARHGTLSHQPSAVSVQPSPMTMAPAATATIAPTQPR